MPLILMVMTIFVPCTSLARLHNSLRVYLGKTLCPRYPYTNAIVQADAALLKHDERDLAKKKMWTAAGIAGYPLTCDFGRLSLLCKLG
jgi:hypothetical protein